MFELNKLLITALILIHPISWMTTVDGYCLYFLPIPCQLPEEPLYETAFASNEDPILQGALQAPKVCGFGSYPDRQGNCRVRVG
uniref:CSON000085 protein n=1 Tax=Culicoides sonorensis TaxID=179676 RepID=A0A336LPB1_CULSO